MHNFLSLAPTSFCKCTCFSNSTIIQLDAPDPLTSPGDFDSAFLQGRDSDKKYRPRNCNDCNRKFCLDYNLPKCKGAKEEDVFTTCFRTWILFFTPTARDFGWQGKIWVGLASLLCEWRLTDNCRARFEKG